MSRFEHCLQVVLDNEGGLSNHPADQGGKTNYGITQRTYDDYSRKLGLPARDVSEIHHTEVESIYYEYWKAARCDILPDGIDLIVFDTAINSGPRRAIKLLQMALGVGVDGIFGPITAEALHEDCAQMGIDYVIDRFLQEREDFYIRIVENNPDQDVFLNGWINRIDKLRVAVHVA